jgi:hypothetical protein
MSDRSHASRRLRRSAGRARPDSGFSLGRLVLVDFAMRRRRR